MTASVATITPVPTDEEAAAIAAAVTMLWPQPVAASSNTVTGGANETWRFSGRWWANDAISRRGRPGR